MSTRRERDWALMLAARTVRYDIKPVVRDRTEPSDNSNYGSCDSCGSEPMFLDEDNQCPECSNNTERSADDPLGTCIEVTDDCCRPGDMTDFVNEWASTMFVHLVSDETEESHKDNYVWEGERLQIERFEVHGDA